MVERDDLVVAAVDDEYGAVNIPDVVSRRVLEPAQPARREPGIEFLGDVGYRREG